MADQFDPKAWTRAHEGFSDEVYLDQRGLPTVGVGHLITETSPYLGAQEGDLLSTKHLEEQYDKDYASHAKLASSNFKDFDKHPQHVKDALINMTFQLGNKPKKWKNFQAALDEGLKTGNYQNAAYHGADSKWFRDQTPKRARSVLDRLAYGSNYNYTRPDALADLPDYTSPRQAAKATPAAQLAAPAPPPVAEDPSWWDRVKAVAGFADGTLTNPEAGPSDTVPAMLTPGEAVIPASVAMDPDFKPVIKEMVDEGRERNRSAESLGIPVNHAAAARPPGEQQGYMGGVPHVDGFADGIGGAFDKLLPESVKAKWQEAKDTKTGVEDAYSAYKWLDEKDAQLRDMSGGYLGIPTWQDPINWELVGEYGDEALKGARTYGKYKRKAGEALDAIGLADGAEGQKTINIPGYGEIPEYLAYSVPGLGPYLNTKNALEAGLSGDWKEAAKQGGFAASNFIPIPQSLQKLAGAGLQTAGKFVGLQGGTDMIPKPMGAPPKYNIDRPDHSEFNVSSENMGEGMKMDLTNAQHRQQVANKEGDHAQKMQHEKEAAAQKMQLDQMKAEQKLMNDQQAEGMKLQMKVADSDVDGMLTQQKQAALDASINGMGFFEEAPVPQPMAPPPGLFDGSAVVGQNQIAGYADGRPSVVNGEYRGYADGGVDVATKAAMIRRFQDKFGLKGEDLKHVIENEVDTLQQVREIQAAEAAAAARAAQAVVPPVARPTPPPQQALAPDPNSTRTLYGAGPSGAVRHLFNELQGRADGGTISKDNDIIVDGQFMSSHVPPIQGLADGGVPNATAGNLDQTDVKGFQNLLFNSGVATAEEAYVDPEYAAREARYKEVEEANKLKKAQEAEAAAQSAVDHNEQLIEETDQVVNDPTVSPEVKAQAASEKQRLEKVNLDNETAVNEGAAAALGIQKTPEAQAAVDSEPGGNVTPNPLEQDTPEKAEAGKQAAAAPAEEKQGWLSSMGDVFKRSLGNLTDPDSLASAALVYGANRLLGYDHDTAGGEALKFHNQSVESRTAGAAAAQADQQKRALDLRDYGLKKQIDAQTADPKEQAKLVRENRQKARTFGAATVKEILDTRGTFTGKDGSKQQITGLTSKAVGGQYEKFMDDLGVQDFNEPGLTAALANATDSALKYASQNKGTTVNDLTPFLWAEYLPQSTGAGTGLFQTKAGGMLAAPRIAEITSEIQRTWSPEERASGTKGTLLTNDMKALANAWSNLDQSVRTDYEGKAGKNTSGFYMFAKEQMGQVLK